MVTKSQKTGAWLPGEGMWQMWGMGSTLFCKLGSEYGGVSFTISLRCTCAFYIFLYLWYTLQKKNPTNPQSQWIHYSESFGQQTTHWNVRINDFRDVLWALKLVFDNYTFMGATTSQSLRVSSGCKWPATQKVSSTALSLFLFHVKLNFA